MDCPKRGQRILLSGCGFAADPKADPSKIAYGFLTLGFLLVGTPPPNRILDAIFVITSSIDGSEANEDAGLIGRL